MLQNLFLHMNLIDFPARVRRQHRKPLPGSFFLDLCIQLFGLFIRCRRKRRLGFQQHGQNVLPPGHVFYQFFFPFNILPVMQIQLIRKFHCCFIFFQRFLIIFISQITAALGAMLFNFLHSAAVRCPDAQNHYADKKRHGKYCHSCDYKQPFSFFLLLLHEAS